MDSINRILDFLIMIFIGYEVKKTDDAMETAAEAKLQLELKENHDAIKKEFSGMSDLDIVKDAIRSNGNK